MPLPEYRIQRPKVQSLDRIPSAGEQPAIPWLHSARRIGIGCAVPRLGIEFSEVSSKPIVHFNSPVLIVPLENPSVSIFPPCATSPSPNGLWLCPPCLWEAREVPGRENRSTRSRPAAP